MDAIIPELFKIMPVGQVVGVVLLAFILRILWQSRDQLREMNVTVVSLGQWMERHENQDLRTFDAVHDSVRDAHRRIDGLDK